MEDCTLLRLAHSVSGQPSQENDTSKPEMTFQPEEMNGISNRSSA